MLKTAKWLTHAYEAVNDKTTQRRAPKMNPEPGFQSSPGGSLDAD